MSKVDKEQLKSWIQLSDDFYLDPDGLLGKGAFGEVFRGYSVKRDCLVAIKTMEGEGYQRQVETLKALSSLIHPNIMGYYGFLEKDTTVYICIEFCPNGTLTDLISEGIEEERALELFRQMIEGMCYMNAKGKMHRDLKPDNVLLGMKQDVKISDFGLARQTSGIFVTGQMGTPLYAAPEVYLNKMEENYSQKCDVWGAGMILYEMLTQKLLFQGVKTFQDLRKEWHLYEIGQRRVEYDKHLHPNWQYLTNFMLTYDPKKRPTFHQVLDRLKKLYDKMKDQIKNKVVHEINENTKIGRLQLLLQFFQQKYGILIKIYDALRQQVITFRPEFKYMMEFLCLCQYVTHIKKLVRSIKYKRVKVNEDDDDDEMIDEGADFDLLLDKYRNSFEHKYNFYSSQINDQVLPKLLQYAKKAESEPIVAAMKDLWELATDVSDGTFDVEETYSEGLQAILKTRLEQFNKGLYQNMKEEELRMINLIFLGASLQNRFDNSHFLKGHLIKDALKSLESKGRNQLLQDIQILKAKLP